MPERGPRDQFDPRRPEVSPQKELVALTNIAIEAAAKSGKIVYDIFHGIPLEKLNVEYKEDATPRTIADIEGDHAIVAVIRQARPQDEILIEESGYHQGLQKTGDPTKPHNRWYADSLDGTRPFVEGKPESTVGVMVCDENNDYLAAAIVHPHRKKVFYAARGQGAFVQDLDINFNPIGEPKQLHVSKKESFTNATISIDSLFTKNNRRQKHAAMMTIENLSQDSNGNITVSYDELGSNIAYQADVALGVSLFGLTDAVGGPWDWRVGEAIITEAGGIMLDPLSGEKPTDKSEIVIYGNETVVNQALPLLQGCYKGYTGFK